MTRNDVLIQACDQCMKELYEYAVPYTTWEHFKNECKIYTEKYKEWKKHNNPKWEDKQIEEYIGPKPFEFYYLPGEIMKDICNSYIHAYEINKQQNLLDIIEILKRYCEDPIVDKWIEEDSDAGYRGYDKPDNLFMELKKLIPKVDNEVIDNIKNKFFEFLDKAGNFYNWNRELNSFNMTIYLGCSPCSNRETVIKNWEKYRNKKVKLHTDEWIKTKYYGE